MISILEKWVVKIIFLGAKILNPFFSRRITVDISAIVLNFEDEDSFFRDENEIDFGSFPISRRDINVSKDLFFGDFKLFNQRPIKNPLTSAPGSFIFGGVEEFVDAVVGEESEYVGDEGE